MSNMMKSGRKQCPWVNLTTDVVRETGSDGDIRPRTRVCLLYIPFKALYLLVEDQTCKFPHSLTLNLVLGNKKGRGERRREEEKKREGGWGRGMEREGGKRKSGGEKGRKRAYSAFKHTLII